MFLNNLTQSLEALQRGETPTARETVADCLMPVLALLVGEYMRGETPLSAELGHLVRALQNPQDPSVKALPMGVGMMLRTQVSQLEALKADFHARKE